MNRARNWYAFDVLRLKSDMKRITALRLLSLAGIGTLVASSAFAQESGYPYGGVSIGQSRAKIDEDRITANLRSLGLNTTAFMRDERDTGFKVFGGYQFNRYVALEGGYFNLGKFGFGATTVPAGTLNGQIKLQGVNLDVVGTLPLVGGLSAIGRVGAQYANARDTFSGSGVVRVLDPNPSKRAANYKVGVGLQYEINRAVLVRGEAERYRINDAVGNHGDVNLFSVSLVVPFGRTPAPAPRVVEAPQYVPPAPAPVAAVTSPAPAPAPARRRVTFSADSLFAFDQSTVSPEGKTALDAFARDTMETRYDLITVEGHTDRLGPQAYNQRLSTKRAEAVKSYLVTAGGLDAAKISAVGKDGSAPVTKPGDCKGNKPNPKLIACLQPDRRVVVEVTGTR